MPESITRFHYGDVPTWLAAFAAIAPVASIVAVIVSIIALGES